MIETLNQLPEVKPYPYRMDDNRDIIKHDIFSRMHNLLYDWALKDNDREDLYDWIADNFEDAEALFAPEETARNQGVEGANLSYHGIPHAVHQATYDGITILNAVTHPRNRLNQYITIEGVAATLVGLIRHDNGYVLDAQNSTDPIPNYAQRIGIHVANSMDIYSQRLNLLPPPSFLNRNKLDALGRIAIHSTHFPFDKARTGEQRELILALPKSDQAEAYIVAYITRFADLGGQCARQDRYPDGLRAFRFELNGEEAEKGDKVIGTEEDMLAKCRWFVNNLLEPCAGRLGVILLGTADNPYTHAWHNLPSQSN